MKFDDLPAYRPPTVDPPPVKDAEVVDLREKAIVLDMNEVDEVTEQSGESRLRPSIVLLQQIAAELKRDQWEPEDEYETDYEAELERAVTLMAKVMKGLQRVIMCDEFIEIFDQSDLNDLIGVAIEVEQFVQTHSSEI